MKKLLLIIIASFYLNACDRNLVIVPEFEPVVSERVVLLEEMTGVSCPNCPKGTAEVESIKALYGDQVVPIGIHGIFLSWPTNESHFDFRNEFSRLLEANLAPGTSKPAALINRAIPEGQESAVILSPDLWGGYVEAQLNIPPKVSIEIELQYDPDTRNLVVNSGIIASVAVNTNLQVSVMILENNIIDAQEDLNEVIEDFHHNHVLRTMLTPYDGELLTRQLSQGEVISKEYEFVLPVEEGLWKEEDIEVVVFVHEPNGEVLQAGITKLFE